MTHRQWSTTRKVHIASAMIVVDGHGDSSWHTQLLALNPVGFNAYHRAQRDH